MYIRHLDIGNLSTRDIKELYDLQFDDFLKIWIFVEGPYKILAFVASKLGHKAVPELNVLSHMCFYCACIFTNHVLSSSCTGYLQDFEQETFHQEFADVGCAAIKVEMSDNQFPMELK